MPKKRDKDEYTPYLTDEMIENQVNEDLMKYQKLSGKSISFPLYPEEMITTLWGVEVEYCDNTTSPEGESVLAYFSPHEKKVYVNISLSGNEGRTSFTLAHEMGHVSLHNFLSKVDNVRALCRGAFIDEQQKVAMIERQADRYASMLLMPRSFLLDKLTELGYEPTKDFDLKAHEQTLKKYFGISCEALELRLSYLGIAVVGGFYKLKPKKIGEAYFEEKELQRQGWGWKG